MYKKFLAKFQDSKCCPLCRRDFPQKSEEDSFKFLLESTIQKVPEVQHKSEKALSEKEKYRDELLSLSSTWDDCSRLQNIEIPKLRAQRDALEKERSSIYTMTEDSESEIAILDLEMTHLKSIVSKADEYLRLRNEVKSLESDVNAISKDLEISGSSKTMDQVSKEYEVIQSQCTSLRKDLDRINESNRLKLKETQVRESKVRELNEKIEQLKRNLNEKDILSQQCNDMKTEIEILRVETRNADNRLEELKHALDISNAQLITFRKNAGDQEGEITAKIGKFMTLVNRVDVIQLAIQSYVADKKELLLIACEEEINRLKVEIAQYERQIAQVAIELDSMNKKKSEVAVIQRNIDDNIKLRKLKKRNIEVEQLIVEAQADLARLDERSINEKLADLQSQNDNLQGERAESVGESKQLEIQIKRLKYELSHDYKDINNKYKNAIITQETGALVCSDIEMYGKAMEAAIMKYHEAKMNEINKIIRELWMKTYKGSDIDAVEIRADYESATQGRSYNYRVVMIKGECEMDMRGRCSAGQKVLTCIIIRLALAESFCLNCGILALDEPTTNLDRENIESLAEALISIIESRKRQSNFQLIVITHDEDFLQLLARKNLCENYFRVSKDSIGLSTIEKHPITD
jgi:DNA repair protein RAD50